MTIKLDIAKEFTPVPAGPLGEWGAEGFRERLLYPRVKQALETDDILEVDFDGMRSFDFSFMEEAFGGLVRSNGISTDDLFRVFRPVPETPYLSYFFERLKEEIQEAEEHRNGE